LELTKNDFRLVEGDMALTMFKMAAFDKIQSLSLDSEARKAEKKNLSIKHQVLCDETAIVGVMKQVDNSSGELIEVDLNFVKETIHDASLDYR